MRIKPNFKVIDAENGTKIGESEIREKTSRFCKLIGEKSQNTDVIFIDFPRSLDTICAILSCLQLDIPFTFCEENREFEHFRTTLVFDGQEVQRIGVNETSFEGICYVITTSGTTGKRKQVAVPDTCIWPNIDAFCSHFAVCTDDSILFSTSLRFDPSIVELFMAFRVGCTIVMTPDAFRSQPSRLQKAIEQYRPTIAQFTATVLEMLPSVDSVLSATSSLRILLVGGSHFPLKFIDSHRNAENATRIFNVYGVTEVSCWATIQEIETDCHEVLIGQPIGGSNLRITEEGELVIGGPRQCYVNGKRKEEHPTRDRAKHVEEGGIRIVGRMDRMVKHRGVRICLDHLTSEALRESPDARAIHFMHHNNRSLVQFVVGPTSTNSPAVHTKTMRISADTVVSVTVCHVASLPINSSGKVDEGELAEGLEAMSEDFDVCGYLESRLKVQLSEKILDGNFTDIGMTSIMAAEMSAFFPTNSQDDVIRFMLDGKRTIREFLETFETEWKQKSTESRVGKTIKVRVGRVENAQMRWEVDFGKCIDGDILIVNDSLVVCASHSGVVCAVNPHSGHVFWRAECGVRFEATPILVNENVVIGSKNGGVFFLSLSTGALVAHILNDKGVRAKCSFDGKFIFCTTEHGIFHVIDPTTKCSMSEAKVGNGGGTSVGPVVGPADAVYAVLTSGWISRIDVEKKNGSATMTWQRDCGPTFAEPVFHGTTSILVLNVHGQFRILDTKSGEIVTQIELDIGNCFCAPLMFEKRALLATKSGRIVAVGLAPEFEMRLIFEFDLPGTSFVKTPSIVKGEGDEEGNRLAMMSTNGTLLTARFLDSLEDVNAVNVSAKKVFTTPVFIDGATVLVAGRDDRLRCWNLRGFM